MSDNSISQPIDLQGVRSASRVTMRFLCCCMCFGLWANLSASCKANDPVSIYLLRGMNEQQFKARLEQQARQKVDTTRAVCNLSPEQRDKLMSAAMVDVTRACNEITAAYRLTEGIDIRDPNGMREASRLLSPISQKMRHGIHDDGSLFAKVLERLLDDSQKSQRQKELMRQEKTNQHVLALAAVASINERVPLLKSQREKLVEILDKYPATDSRNNVNPYLAYMRLANTNENDLQRFLDEEQIRAIQKLCERYRAAGLIVR